MARKTQLQKFEEEPSDWGYEYDSTVVALKIRVRATCDEHAIGIADKLLGAMRAKNIIGETEGAGDFWPL